MQRRSKTGPRLGCLQHAIKHPTDKATKDKDKDKVAKDIIMGQYE
jgi:hypothetical protein